MASIRSWKAEILASLALGGVGGYFLKASLALPPPDEPGVPGSGTVPMLLGGFIVLGALILLIMALRRERTAMIELGNRKPAFALASLIIGALMFEPAGFLLATFVFLTAGFTVLGGAPWHRAAPAAALTSVALWLIFTKLLGVGLPYGLIGEVLFK